MKWWLLAVVVGLYLIASPSSASEPARKKPLWFSDYEKARASARETGQPLFVVFR